MPWGWECRQKLIKQVPAKPAERRGAVSGEAPLPGPNCYELPQIFCGNGFSAIKRAPEYIFGHLTPAVVGKPARKPNAPVFNCQGLTRKGLHKITHCVLTPAIPPLSDKEKVPGPGAYEPRKEVQIKRPPAYTAQPPARPAYQPWDSWTPSSNMYCPPIPSKKAPAYTMGYGARDLKPQDFPGPGEHEPNFSYVCKTKPAFSFGGPFRNPKRHKTPAPNTYCVKKFVYTKTTAPAPSLGIRHSPYLGQYDEYLKSSKLDLLAAE